MGSLAQDGAARRLALAALVSALLHTAFVLVVRPEPASARRGSAASVLTATLDARPPESPPGSVPIAAPDPAPAAPAVVPPPIARSTASEAVRLPPVPQRSRPEPQADPAAPAPAPASGLPEVPVIRDPTWYPVRQLDVLPRALQAVVPEFPERAERERVLAGEVTLLLLVDEDGRVHELSVVEAKPEGYFEESALQAFREAKFAPGRRDGRVVKSRVLVRVNFTAGAR